MQLPDGNKQPGAKRTKNIQQGPGGGSIEISPMGSSPLILDDRSRFQTAGSQWRGATAQPQTAFALLVGGGRSATANGVAQGSLESRCGLCTSHGRTYRKRLADSVVVAVDWPVARVPTSTAEAGAGQPARGVRRAYSIRTIPDGVTGDTETPSGALQSRGPSRQSFLIVLLPYNSDCPAFFHSYTQTQPSKTLKPHLQPTSTLKFNIHHQETVISSILLPKLVNCLVCLLRAYPAQLTH